MHMEYRNISQLSSLPFQRVFPRRPPLVLCEPRFHCLSSQVGFIGDRPPGSIYLLKKISYLVVALKWFGVFCVLALMEVSRVLLYVLRLLPQL